MTATAATKAKLPLNMAPVTFALQRLPRVRRTLWRAFYNTIHRQVRADDFVFMNLGYASPQDEALPGPIDIDYFPQRLYERVAGAVELAGKDVLEVGCGRGGGAAHLHSTFAPRSLVGVDLSQRGIAACSAKYTQPGLEFRVGDACNLPLSDASFDAVLSVESSHCYPSRERFFAEVKRVLRPGGHFLYADVFWPHLEAVDLAEVEGMLASSGMSVLEAEDISQNVARARRLLANDPTLELTLDRWANKKSGKTVAQARKEAYALPGSYHYQSLIDGSARYRRWVLQRPVT